MELLKWGTSSTLTARQKQDSDSNASVDRSFFVAQQNRLTYTHAVPMTRSKQKV
jgi:hypothetical protein